MNKITGETVDAFRADFNEAMKPLAEKYGFTISLGSISYSDDYFTSKLTVENETNPDLLAEARFNRDAWKFEEYGIHEGMYRQMFLSRNGEKYALLGFIPNAKKYPLRIVRFSDGHRFRVSPNFIKEFLDMKYAENLDEDQSEKE